MWPGFFIEALEGRLNGCTGGDERGRGALLSSLFVGPWGLDKLALAVLDVDLGYRAVPIPDDFVPLFIFKIYYFLQSFATRYVLMLPAILPNQKTRNNSTQKIKIPLVVAT